MDICNKLTKAQEVGTLPGTLSLGQKVWTQNTCTFVTHFWKSAYFNRNIIGLLFLDALASPETVQVGGFVGW